MSSVTSQILSNYNYVQDYSNPLLSPSIELYPLYPNTGTIPVPHDIFQMTAPYLRYSELAVWAQLNKEGRVQTTEVVLFRAEQLGYEGQDEIEAAKYLKDLFIEILRNNRILTNYCIYKPYIRENPPRYTFLETFSRKKKESVFEECTKINLELTLNKLAALSTKDALSLIHSTLVYENADPREDDSQFRKIRKVVSLNHRCWDRTDQELSQLGIEILSIATRYGEKDLTKILLDYGVNPNMPNKLEGWTPLHWATYYVQPDLVFLLIARGASVNIGTRNYKKTALALAIARERELDSSMSSLKYEDGRVSNKIGPDVIWMSIYKATTCTRRLIFIHERITTIIKVLEKNGAKKRCTPAILQTRPTGL